MDNIQRKIFVYGVISGAHFTKNNLEISEDIQIADNIIMCSNPAITLLPTLHDDSRNRISKDEMDTLLQLKHALSVELKVSINEEAAKIKDAIDHMFTFLGYLRIIKPHRALLKFVYTYYPDENVLVLNLLNSLDFCYSTDESVDLFKFDFHDSSQIDLVIKNTSRVMTSDNRIKRAFTYYNSAFFERIGELQLLIFVMALESLFSTADAELRYSISLRVAKYLSSDMIGREKIFDHIQKSYDLRSKIVHGSKLNRDIDHLKNAVIAIRNIIHQCLYKIISDKTEISNFINKNQYCRFIKELALS